MTENKDKELLDILKSVGMTDEEIKDAILKGDIKLGFEDIEKSESKEKEEKEEKEEGKPDVEKEEETAPESSEKDIEKAKENDLFKSFEGKFSAYDEKLNKVEELTSKNDELQKSVNSMTEMIESLKSTVDKMANQVPAAKYVGKLNVIEKSAGNFVDEEERTVISLSGQREELGEALLKAMNDEVDPIMKSAIESDLMNVSAGAGVPTPVVAKHLFDKHKIRIAK